MTDTLTLFEGRVRLRTGPLHEIALAALEAQTRTGQAQIFVFDDVTGSAIDLDLSGAAQAVVDRYGPEPKGRGRPKLGVAAREVTLLPRHWEWLATQPGGASVTLRKLVEQARRDDTGQRRARLDAAYRFGSAMAGDLAGFEDAVRALYAGDREGFDARIAAWPADVAGHMRRLAYGD
ncbi:DUF2239 family protein [Phenylobacterium immobile]|uniref:DUF2239 family protein n=1 Tax=Phenylobacterium immobile TaxID=21 RepID=UPI000A4173A0|nr:DUF2239 family protein [Phenylobacterium immobile]